MTNINCNKNCLYQSDGKCSYDCVLRQPPQEEDSEDKECLYFRAKSKPQMRKL